METWYEAFDLGHRLWCTFSPSRPLTVLRGPWEDPGTLRSVCAQTRALGPQLPWASAHWAQCFPRGTGPTLSFTTKLIPSAHAPSGAGAAADRCPGRRHCEDLNLPLSIAVR